MFGNNPYPYMPQGPAYQRPAFQQPMQMYPQQMQQPAMMQDGSIQARFVSGREEAVASNVMPGSMFLFHDRANGMIYSKLIDPQTGMPEFKAYAEVQPEQQQAPQYVTADAFAAFQQQIEQRFAALTPKTSRKAVVVNDDE
ncbi:MAG: hypothetical protein J6J78_02780 [Clostridia bacterium]|nr:hypothetical protein [Clostridia bacterium]